MDDKVHDVVAAIKENESFIISTHVNPDGDAVGSVCAVFSILKSLGKNVRIFCNDNVSKQYAFLTNEWNSELETNSFDCAIVLDCPTVKRTGTTVSLLENCKSIINIDHHISNDFFGTVNWVDPNASSVGEMVFALLELLDIKMTVEIATAIYVAISTDTGSFCYQNTTAMTHKIAAVLHEANIDGADLNHKIYGSMPFKRVKLQGIFIDTIAFAFDNKVAWGYLSLQDLEKLEATAEDTDGLINIVRNIEGVEVAFFLRETEDGKVKVSFRSSGNADVNKIAANFSGSGSTCNNRRCR